MTTIDMPPYFNSMTESFFGLTTDNVDDNEKRKQLYQEFLVMNQLQDSAIAQATVEEQALYLAQFSQFLNQQLEKIYLSEEINGLSPEEMIKRDILLETFETILKMLISLQITVKQLTQSLVFYTKWQNEYTNQLTKIPLYTQSAPNTISYNPSNFGESSLGYGNTRIKDMIAYLLDKVKNDIGEGKSGTTTQYFGPDVCFQLEYTKTKVRFIISKPGTVKDGVLSEPTTIFKGNQIQIPAQQNDLLTIVSPIADDMQKEIENSTTADGVQMRTALQAGTLTGLSWPDVTIFADDTDKDKARSGIRGEVNGKLQLYIENSRSLRQQVQDRMQPIQDLLSQTRDAIQNQSNLIGSIIDSLKGVISNLFR